MVVAVPLGLAARLAGLGTLDRRGPGCPLVAPAVAVLLMHAPSAACQPLAGPCFIAIALALRLPAPGDTTLLP
eukprot:8726765-Heterocapsa_arctica.AAC.1